MSHVTPTGMDCHAHILDPMRFAYADGPGYRPRADEHGTRERYAHVLRDNNISHAVLVQPSCYGFDNRAMLDAIAGSGGRWKGIAVVPVDVDDASLAQLARCGIVGARANLGAFDPAFFERTTAPAWLARMRAIGWHVQVYGQASAWRRVAPLLADSGATVIIDHFGHPDVREPASQPGFDAMLALGKTGRAYLKLSAPYRSSREPASYADVRPFVLTAINAFGVDRCIFGTDWPFINTAHRPTYAGEVAWLATLVPDAADRRRIMVDNPASLFGFHAPAGLAEPRIHQRA